MRTPEAVYWASCAIMLAVSVGAFIVLMRWTRRLRTATAQCQEATRERAELGDWARWTVLSVTERDGMIWSTTIAELFHEKAEKVWTDPIATAIWSTHPAEQAEGMLRAALGGDPERNDG